MRFSGYWCLISVLKETDNSQAMRGHCIERGRPGPSMEVLISHVNIHEKRSNVSLMAVPLLLTRRPLARCPAFRLSVDADVGGAQRSLFAITGACSGAELRLTADSIPFGTVLLGSEVISHPNNMQSHNNK